MSAPNTTARTAKRSSAGQKVEDGDVGYVEMSSTLAGYGVEKWTFDTTQLTITYSDRAGNVLLRENVE